MANSRIDSTAFLQILMSLIKKSGAARYSVDTAALEQLIDSQPDSDKLSYCTALLAKTIAFSKAYSTLQKYLTDWMSVLHQSQGFDVVHTVDMFDSALNEDAQATVLFGDVDKTTVDRAAVFAALQQTRDDLNDNARAGLDSDLAKAISVKVNANTVAMLVKKGLLPNNCLVSAQYEQGRLNLDGLVTSLKDIKQ